MDEVVVGTYEGFLLGYSVSYEFERKLSQTFATHSHTSSVRCLDMSGRFLASGGTDDKVVVIDMKTRKEHTVLMHHDGTVNALVFTNAGTHLLTGSSDGSIVVIRTGNWQIEKKWKKAHGDKAKISNPQYSYKRPQCKHIDIQVHQGKLTQTHCCYIQSFETVLASIEHGSAIDAIAVHPSDKLALSIGGDKTLRTWNLVKGRPAFTINLSSKGVTMATDIAWSPGGDRFSLISQQTVDIWTITKAGIEKRITCNSKPACVAWISDEVIAIGLENGNILTVTITNTQALTCQAHKHRVKCLYYISHSLYSASSAGELKMWNYSGANCLEQKCVVATGGRVTCMTLNQQKQFIKKESTDDEHGIVGGNEQVEDDAEVDVKTDEVSLKRNSSFVSVQYEHEQDDEPIQKQIKRKKKPRKNFKKSLT